VVLLAHLEMSGTQGNRRESDRHLLKLRVPGSTPSKIGIVVLVHDLSLTGLLIETSAELSIGADLEVDLPEAGRRQAKVVWNSGHYFGCEFHAPISSGGLSAASLRSPAASHANPPNSAYSEFEDEDETEKSPIGTRLWIIALGLAFWTLLLVVFTLI
jgi:hypothetical protein